MRHLPTQGDAAKPLPGDRIGELAAEELITEAAAELQEHDPQVGVQRHRRAAEARVEVCGQRGQEAGVVQQLVDPGQLGGQPQEPSGRIASHSEGWGWWSAASPLQSVVA
jgi:hypothetical protein